MNYQPWRSVTHNGVWAVEDSRGDLVATGIPDSRTAELFAAAPDLLDNLDELVGQMDMAGFLPGSVTLDTLHSSRAAIQKARGV